MRRLIILALLLITTVAMAQTTIRVQGYGGQDPAIVQRLIDEVIGADLAAAGITIQYEPIETDYNAVLTNALSAGTAADVFYIPGETAPGIIATGKVMALDGRIDTAAFIPSLMSVYEVDGHVYGISKDFNTLAVFYNKDFFDAAGVEYPDADDDWNDFAAKLQAVSDLGPDVYGACLPADFARMGAWAYANGWTPLTDDGGVDLSDPTFASAFEHYTSLVTSGVAVQPADLGAGWPGDCLANEQAAVAIEGAWMLGFLRDTAPNLQYGTAPLPLSPTTGERGNFIYTVAWGVNADTANPDAALAVLEALTSEKAQQFILEQGLAIPSREALADNPYFTQDTAEAKANLTIFENASDGAVLGFQFGSVGTDYMGPLNNALSSVMSGQADSQTALQEAQRELDALLQRSR